MKALFSPQNLKRWDTLVAYNTKKEKLERQDWVVLMFPTGVKQIQLGLQYTVVPLGEK